MKHAHEMFTAPKSAFWGRGEVKSAQDPPYLTAATFHCIPIRVQLGRLVTSTRRRITLPDQEICKSPTCATKGFTMAKKKATRKKATRKKAARKKVTRKKTTRKKATRKKATKKKATRKKAKKKATRKKATKKKATRKKAKKKVTRKKATKKKATRKKATRRRR